MFIEHFKLIECGDILLNNWGCGICDYLWKTAKEDQHALLALSNTREYKNAYKVVLSECVNRKICNSAHVLLEVNKTKNNCHDFKKKTPSLSILKPNWDEILKLIKNKININLTKNEIQNIIISNSKKSKPKYDAITATRAALSKKCTDIKQKKIVLKDKVFCSSYVINIWKFSLYSILMEKNIKDKKINDLLNIIFPMNDKWCTPWALKEILMKNDKFWTVINRNHYIDSEFTNICFSMKYYKNNWLPKAILNYEI